MLDTADIVREAIFHQFRLAAHDDTLSEDVRFRPSNKEVAFRYLSAIRQRQSKRTIPNTKKRREMANIGRRVEENYRYTTTPALMKDSVQF